jgi:peptidoglycan-associated lipoprotein
MKKILATLAMAGIIISGCASKGTVKETSQPQQKATQKEQIKDKMAEKKVSQETVSAKESADLDSLRLIREMQAKMKDVHFDFDRYAIRNDDKPILKEVAETLKKNSTLKVTIEGNCDERGTNEYNLALGDRRATAAKDVLLSLGIQSGRMDTVSYGEEKPLCTQNSETCWAKNRRDHFVLDGGKH